MENIISRHRNLSILVAVLFLQVLGLAIQVRRPKDSGVRLIRVWAVSAVTPFEKALVGTGRGVRDSWRNYLYLRGVRAENRALREQIANMRLEQVRVLEDAAQARRLQALLQFKQSFISATIAAQVIGTSGSQQSRALYIDKGSRHGIKPDLAVITPDGIVGKVKDVFPTTSLVLEINDQSSGVGAILEKSRLQGILKGTPQGELTLAYLMSDEKVEVGERVLTSGGDRIFPKGMPVGTVKSVRPGRDLFLNIEVKPAAQLTKLEEVLVITKVEEKAPDPNEVGPVRASDILAQRLPSVPPKPETPPKPAAPKPAAATGETKPATATATPEAPRPQNGAAAVAAPARENAGPAPAAKPLAENTNAHPDPPAEEKPRQP
jgi:rod shape-determining protein MreC